MFLPKDIQNEEYIYRGKKRGNKINFQPKPNINLNSIKKIGKRKIEDHLNFKVLNGIIAPKEYLKIKLATGI